MTQTLETQLAANKRLKIYKSSPELLDAMMALSTAAAKDVDPEIGELIKIRASQINHCGFCLNMHLAGDLFSERERAALALTEAITEIADGVPDDVYERAAAVFDDRELGQVIAMAVTINTWNRINVTVRTAVPRR